MEAKQRARREQFDDVFDIFSMLVGGNYVTIYDIKDKMTRFSPSIVEMVGLPGEYIDDGVYDWLEYVHPEDREIYERTMEEMFALHRKSYDVTYRVRLKSGIYTSFRMIGGVIRDMDGNPSIIGGMMINAGIVSTVDRVTGLQNAARFFDNVGKIVADRNGMSEPVLTVLLFGFGRLSHINEIYGYGYGSRLLKKVGKIVREEAGDARFVYRMDGSKFAIVSGKNAGEAGEMYERIRRRLRDGIEQQDSIHNLVTYGGVIELRDNALGERTIYDCLLYACNESRTYRRGDLVVYDGSHLEDPGLSGSIATIGAVRESIGNDYEGFFLLYQPIFQPGSNIPIGAEALLRWRSPEGRVVLPMDFLPEIENDVAYRNLGYWIIRHALLDSSKFLKQNPSFFLSLNVSPSQISDAYFADNVADLASDAQFPLENLSFELTRECRFLQDLETIRNFVAALRRKDIRIGIDDFARGNAWIKTFDEVSADYVKFSRELAVELEESEKEQKIVRHLSELVDDCGAKVFVKGVETEGMLGILEGLPITGLQGFFFSKPVYYDEILEMQ